MHIHLIGVCGTGMGSLAGLLRSTGHHVTGSDRAFEPPMGEALRRWGVRTMLGFDPSHLEPRPDLVVIGNVCRANNPEAQAAMTRGLRYLSMPGTLEELYLSDRRNFVVGGTHGKTTTTSMLAHLLAGAGRQPGFLIGGVPLDLDESFRAGISGGPFVIEGDEYDSAFFEKTPKFWRYRPSVAALTSLEHDHIDIYPDMDSYRAAFVPFVEGIAPEGLLVAYAGDPEVRAVARHARCRVSYYALTDDDCGELSPEWCAAPVAGSEDGQPFDLFVGGSSLGRMLLCLSGRHNLRNAVACIAMATEGSGVSAETIRDLLPRFRGVKRRQELVGLAAGVRVYDDFAHHPTAVAITLAGLRERHPEGRLIAVFEPRSATASRQLHQDVYAEALMAADIALLAPVARPEIPSQQRLDVASIREQLRAAGKQAFTPADIPAMVTGLVALARTGDTIIVMSNGAFGGLIAKLLVALAASKPAASIGGVHESA